jgi:tRNA(Ile2) C34 agmatinyltransferase TiaS
MNEALFRLLVDVIGVSLYAVPAAAAVYVAFRLRPTRPRRLSWARDICPACGYDCRATPDRCPECGRNLNHG